MDYYRLNNIKADTDMRDSPLKKVKISDCRLIKPSNDWEKRVYEN